VASYEGLYNFYSGSKGLIQAPLALFTVYVGEGLEYRHTGGRGLKLRKKPSYDIWTFSNRVENLFRNRTILTGNESIAIPHRALG